MVFEVLLGVKKEGDNTDLIVLNRYEKVDDFYVVRDNRGLVYSILERNEKGKGRIAYLRSNGELLDEIEEDKC